MLRIHQALQAGGFPNASKLAREVEVSTKTIHRDIEFMRDRLNLPVETGAVRASLVHYNTFDEVHRFGDVLRGLSKSA